jgi:hypothetical protein
VPGPGRLYLLEFRRRIVELVRAGSKPGGAGERVRAEREDDPEVGRADGRGRGPPLGRADDIRSARSSGSSAGRGSSWS